jgi:putative GTP pyrophosphokinase
MTEGCQREVSQRLKRMTTILDKLVGTCRAVLATLDEVHRVERRLRENRPPLDHYDYITSPRASGYRATHIVVGYTAGAGTRRAIEVQLRTTVMHEWAVTVERLSGRLRDDLKSGHGPAAFLDFLAAISEAMALEERGEAVPDGLTRRISALRQDALPWLARP